MIVNRRSFRYLMTETSKNAPFVRARAHFIETSKKMTNLQLFKLVYGEWLSKKIIRIEEKNKNYISFLLAEEELIVFTSDLINDYEKNTLYSQDIEIHEGDDIGTGLERERMEL